ncbi:MAG: glutamine--tRNA ligase/YqeY domain fusion protein [Desulfobacterota bacterium]|nr:glutamine--tRNA ligase/YqeY domain fusion protein [Thermodesulfobacteriota bacterium]MDW8002551.1 glutamine--tRNA ligase/YqeY domain fusion protein [Deltaproteobacteria bacterium]
MEGLRDFIREIIEKDLKEKKYSKVITRFPPEPNGYLHIGHAKSICLNFGIAEEFGGKCNLRMDDTDPEGEKEEYVKAIIEDVKWLGFDFGEKVFYASDYFEKLYEYARELIKKGKAYVCHLTPEELKASRGNFTQPGKKSPYRERSVEENLELFERMKNGEFEEGTCVLRAKIDMQSPNMVMRDPVIYRIKKVPHYRTGNKWNIYPMYDFAHPLSDAIEGVTHSICTLEFENNRPLYEWFVEELVTSPEKPKQIEFARLNLSHTVLSKRLLSKLVDEKIVDGWDDPRMPTLAGLRRRGYTPDAIKDFIKRIGVARNENLVDISLLEHCVREDLDWKAPRIMGVIRPIEVLIENYPQGKFEILECPNHPKRPEMGSRKIIFAREIYIDEEDFSETPPPGYKRLTPGGEVRLRYAYRIRCKDVIKDETGRIKTLICTYDPESKNVEKKGKEGVIHWVAKSDAIAAEVRLYDRLFTVPDPASYGDDFLKYINPKSLEIIFPSYVEKKLAQSEPGSVFQFERVGYFCIDSKDSKKERPVLNLVVPLKDPYSKKIK